MSADAERRLQLGERMYRDGLLPSGEPMQALVSGDVPVEGTAFTCVSCHQRSGRGSLEGRVFTPPTDGANLYQPLKQYYKGIEVTSLPLRRPAYTDASLAAALRDGVDPAGRSFGSAMPRYRIGDEEMAILIDYLKALSSRPSPGATDASLRFATVVAGEVRPEERDAMLRPLEDFVALKNNTAEASRSDVRVARMSRSMFKTRLTGLVRISLVRWVLEGPPETWRRQLEERYAADPVFALVGGISAGDWRPIHEFSEAHQIPAIFPVTDFPVISEKDWYTLYLSKGYHQEGEAAARFLHSREESPQAGEVVEIVSASREGRALAEGFRATWRELGHAPPTDVLLKEGESVSAELLERAARGKPAAILVWAGPEALTPVESLAAGAWKPPLVMLSSSYLGPKILELGEPARDLCFVTYPHRLPGEETRFRRFLPTTDTSKVTGAPLAIMKRAAASTEVLTRALLMMKSPFTREALLDTIGMMPDIVGPLYERLSFGPGQRYASKGCYIVQLTGGPDPGFVKRSEWVIR